MTSTLQIKKIAIAPYTHCLFAWHNRSIPTRRRQIANRWMQLQPPTSHQTIWHLQWLSPTSKASDLQVSWIESRKWLFCLTYSFPRLNSNADTELSAHQICYHIAELSCRPYTESLMCMYVVCAVNRNMHVWLQRETASGVPIRMLAVLQGSNCDAKQNEMPALESKCWQESWYLLNWRWPPEFLIDLIYKSIT
jgi:hypothetical protein